MNATLTQDKIPTEEGYYLFRGGFSKDYDLIHVVMIKSQLGDYLGVANYRGRNVKAVIGFFSDKLEFNV